jgi:hypothetical protein
MATLHTLIKIHVFIFIPTDEVKKNALNTLEVV